MFFQLQVRIQNHTNAKSKSIRPCTLSLHLIPGCIPLLHSQNCENLPWRSCATTTGLLLDTRLGGLWTYGPRAVHCIGPGVHQVLRRHCHGGQMHLGLSPKKALDDKKGAVPTQGEGDSLQVGWSGVIQLCQSQSEERHRTGQGCPQQEDWRLPSGNQFQAGVAGVQQMTN